MSQTLCVVHLKHGIEKPAWYIVGRHTLCQSCKEGEPVVATGFSKPAPAAAPTVSVVVKTPVEPNIEKSKGEVKVEKCFCGRDKGHRGRHIGSASSPAKNDSAKKAPHVNGNNHTPRGDSEIIARLKEQRDRYTKAIEILEEIGVS